MSHAPCHHATDQTEQRARATARPGLSAPISLGAPITDVGHVADQTQRRALATARPAATLTATPFAATAIGSTSVATTAVAPASLATTPLAAAPLAADQTEQRELATARSRWQISDPALRPEFAASGDTSESVGAGAYAGSLACMGDPIADVGHPSYLAKRGALATARSDLGDPIGLGAPTADVGHPSYLGLRPPIADVGPGLGVPIMGAPTTDLGRPSYHGRSCAAGLLDLFTRELAPNGVRLQLVLADLYCQGTRDTRGGYQTRQVGLYKIFVC